jgi:hypothetical protein
VGAQILPTSERTDASRGDLCGPFKRKADGIVPRSIGHWASHTVIDTTIEDKFLLTVKSLRTRSDSKVSLLGRVNRPSPREFTALYALFGFLCKVSSDHIKVIGHNTLLVQNLVPYNARSSQFSFPAIVKTIREMPYFSLYIYITQSQ